MKLRDIASVIRTKNSGPYELTMDIMFKEEELYRRAENYLNVFEKEF